MIIEIRGVSFYGLGAELMISAIQQRLGDGNPNVQFAIRHLSGPYARRAEYGLLNILPNRGLRRSAILSRLLPQSFHRSYGLVAEESIDAVLDASGFAYSDQWGAGSSQDLLRLSGVVKKGGRDCPIILLPQAFGPFEDPQLASTFRQCLDQVDLAFARDPDSLGHLRRLAPGAKDVHSCPDFTVAAATDSVAKDAPRDYVCLSPNIRMLDKLEQKTAAAYLEFLQTCCLAVADAGYAIRVTTHTGSGDESVASELADRGIEFESVHGHDIHATKRCIGGAALCIGSRFHYLMSAFALGVPCLGAGWSHKYRYLFEDFGASRYLLTPDTPEATVRERIGELLDATSRPQLCRRIEQGVGAYKTAIESMWRQVEARLGLESAPALVHAPPGSPHFEQKSQSSPGRPRVSSPAP